MYVNKNKFESEMQTHLLNQFPHLLFTPALKEKLCIYIQGQLGFVSHNGVNVCSSLS